MHDGQPLGADLKYVGVANQRRGRADACSKVAINSYIPQALQHLIALPLKHFSGLPCHTVWLMGLLT